MDAIGYIRISKKDQSVHSLEYQEKSIAEYCDRNQISLGSVFVDDGESSYTFDRPDYRALENFIKEHKSRVKYLIVFDHDRFSRNLPEALQKIEYLEKKHNLKVIATSEPLDIDTSDPSVFLLRAFKYLIANQELLTIRRRAKMSARHAQQSGRYINQAPYGYLNGKDVGGKPLLHVDETKAFIVQKIYRDFLAGVPRFLIHKEIRELGFPHSGNGAIFRILINPLYAGLVRVCASGKYPEKIIQGIHEAIITPSQYWRVQEILDDTKRSMRTKPKEDYPLKGILKSICCNTTMTAGWSKGKRKYYLYYRCVKHSNFNVSGIEVHERFNDLLRNLSFPEDFINEIVAEVTEGMNKTLKIRDKQLVVIKTQLAAAEKKIDNTEMNLVEENINGKTYKKLMRKLSAEKARLEDELNYLEEDMEDQIRQDLLVLPYMMNLPAIFKDASLNQQHAIINEVFKEGLNYQGGTFTTPSINPRFAHNLLKLKELGLLEIKQPYDNSDIFSSCGEGGIRTLGTVSRTSV
jgi:site-specific DNA recombinase